MIRRSINNIQITVFIDIGSLGTPSQISGYCCPVIRMQTVSTAPVDIGRWVQVGLILTVVNQQNIRMAIIIKVHRQHRTGRMTRQFHPAICPPAILISGIDIGRNMTVCTALLMIDENQLLIFSGSPRGQHTDRIMGHKAFGFFCDSLIVNTEQQRFRGVFCPIAALADGNITVTVTGKVRDQHISGIFCRADHRISNIVDTVLFIKYPQFFLAACRAAQKGQITGSFSADITGSRGNHAGNGQEEVHIDTPSGLNLIKRYEGFTAVQQTLLAIDRQYLWACLLFIAKIAAAKRADIKNRIICGRTYCGSVPQEKAFRTAPQDHPFSIIFPAVQIRTTIIIQIRCYNMGQINGQIHKRITVEAFGTLRINAQISARDNKSNIHQAITIEIAASYADASGSR